jgi:hypothetical protein
MRTYQEAAALADAGAKIVCSTASGRTRWLAWSRNDDGNPVASIYGNVIATFEPTGERWYIDPVVKIDTCGYPTPSTFDAIGAALGVAGNRNGVVGTVKRVPTLLGVGFTRYATVDLVTGKVIDHDEPSQAAPPRPHNGPNYTGSLR